MDAQMMVLAVVWLVVVASVLVLVRVHSRAAVPTR